MKNHNTHNWSGWPGAYCLDCGIDDPWEFAVAGPYNPVDEVWNESNPDYAAAKKACDDLLPCPQKKNPT